MPGSGRDDARPSQTVPVQENSNLCRSKPAFRLSLRCPLNTPGVKVVTIINKLLTNVIVYQYVHFFDTLAGYVDDVVSEPEGMTKKAFYQF